MRALPVVLAGVAAVAAAEVAVNVVLRPQVGPPALAAVFEPHLLAVGVVAAVLAVLLTLGDRGSGGSRIRLLAVVVVVLGVVRLGGEWWSPDPAPGGASAAQATPRETAPGATAPGEARTLLVLSWNLELGSKAAATSVKGLLAMDPRPDLVALQELTPDVAAAIEAEAALVAEYPYRILEPRDGVAGMGLLSRFPLVVGGYETEPVVLRASMLLPDGSPIEVLNVHPYPPDITRAFGSVPVGIDTRRRDEDLSVLAAMVDQADDRSRVLLVGDLNTSPFEPGFGKISAGLLDAHGEAGTGTGFTWRPSTLEGLDLGLVRIDHVLTGDALRPVAVAEDCSLPGDHCRLSVTLDVSAR